MLAEWTDDSFTSLKVMWSDVAVQGALATYMVTYVPVGNTVGTMNGCSSGERTAMTLNNSIVLNGLDLSKFYLLHVEVLTLPVTMNSDQVVIGKCMCAYVVPVQVHSFICNPFKPQF